MITVAAFQKLAVVLPEVEVAPHFDKISFRVRKKIFVTLDVANKRACMKLSMIDQSVFSTKNTTIVYPVPNKWGKSGWTFFELSKVNKNLCIDALHTAYCEVAPQSLALLVRSQQ